jgi:hypothetical protein
MIEFLLVSGQFDKRRKDEREIKKVRKSGESQDKRRSGFYDNRSKRYREMEEETERRNKVKKEGNLENIGSGKRWKTFTDMS